MKIYFSHRHETLLEVDAREMPGVPEKGQEVYFGETAYIVIDVQWHFNINSRGGTMGRILKDSHIFVDLVLRRPTPAL